MADIQWTSAQKDAMVTVDRNVLLTASAGAGKTAVLAQRCLFLLTDAPKRCNIDELLVLTFTEAAAAEMRQRIGQVLQQRIAEEPTHRHLRQQLAWLDAAAISTIHAFCATLVRENHFLLNIDPAFEILDGREAALLRLHTAESLFEDFYRQASDASGDQPFLRFIDSYGGVGSDRSLVELLIHLDSFLGSLGPFETWYQACRQHADALDSSEINALPLVQKQKKSLVEKIDRVIDILSFSENSITHFPKADFYRKDLQDKLLPHLQGIQSLLKNDNFEEALAKLQNWSWPGLSRRSKGIEPEETEPVKKLIDSAKEQYKAAQTNLALPGEEVLKQLQASRGYTSLLCSLHQEFVRRYQQAKNQQRVLDFNDLEHYCLLLLTDAAGGPSAEAREALIEQTRRQFKYVLVDEYQDISPIQEMLIQAVSQPDPARGNLFMVGDVKQSIYGFRQADPAIFLKKYHTFQPDASALQRRIDLNQNFRSSAGVINAVNAIFGRCMTQGLSGLDYAGEAALVYGGTCEGSLPENRCTELHLVETRLDKSSISDTADTDDADEETALTFLEEPRREAMVVGRRILEMVGANSRDGNAEFKIKGPGDQSGRPVTWRDIVILLRTMKGQAEMWSETLQQMGVPVHAELTSGYFEATEIQDMISLLRLIDNPQQDIHLAAILRSPLVALTESELAALRLHCPKESFYQAFERYRKNGPDAGLKDKIVGFQEQLSGWRRLARQKQLSELIWQIYRQTHLLTIVSGQRQGRQRYNNLLHLHDRACQFDSFARQGLSRFLRYLEKMREEEGDFSPAPVLTEADNVVRIMSIHQSKGLEFPVVIVGGLARRFNLQDSNKSIQFSRRFPGQIGMKLVDPITRNSWNTVPRYLMADAARRDSLAEEMRLLYVALTRAGQKLILAASVSLDKKLSQWQPWGHEADVPLPDFLLANARAAIDWIGPALAGQKEMRALMEDRTEEGPEKRTGDLITIYTHTRTRLDEINKGLSPGDRSDEAPLEIADILPTHDLKKLSPNLVSVIDRLQWRYPAAAVTRVEARCSVTDLKHQVQADQDPDFLETRQKTIINQEFQSESSGIFDKKPTFLRKKEATIAAADIGSWTHLFLQRLDLTEIMDQPALQNQLRCLTEQEVFKSDQAQAIDMEQIAQLFQHPLGQQIIAHRDHLHREWPFTLALPVGDVHPDLNKSDFQKEKILIRGIIDCLFETREGMVIIDYKTDNITSEESRERARFYQIPMRIYSQAVEAILQKPVVATHLYFLKPAVATEM